MTPGVGTGRKKSVSFPAHVVDNEGKTTSFAARIATPKAVPGKFPSPFTPRTLPQPQATEKCNSKITEDLPTKRPVELSPTMRRAKDDTDLTIDVSEPRSESGRYWKEQYVSYAEKSEKEMKRLVAKHQMAKSYAKRKDEEAMELRTKLTESNRDHHIKEREMSEQLKDLKRQLLKAHDQVTRLTGEMNLLKRKLEESRIPTTPPQSSDVWLSQTETANAENLTLGENNRRDPSKQLPVRSPSQPLDAQRASRGILCPRDTNRRSPANRNDDEAGRKAHVEVSESTRSASSRRADTELAGTSVSSPFKFCGESENRPPTKSGKSASASPSSLKNTHFDWEPSQVAGMESELNISRVSRRGGGRTPLPQDKSAAARARIKARREANATRRKKA